jgi:glycosyltransferase involved in cell wall biosynthesis
MLFVGRIDVERKNIARILRAWQNIHPRDRVDTEFIVVTDQRRSVIDRVLKTTALNDLDGSVRFLNNVSTEQLIELLSAAVGLVFASQAEGFGLPILEAMQCGCPVITSNTSSMPEVGGSAALYVNPKSLESIQEAITTLLHDDALCQKLRTLGLARAQEFSWKATAKSTVDVYATLVNAR